ncbi:N-acetyltransferase [Burkholderia multivorans]|uniref:GNAT family N-acetyltransferase n=1 Tax=Burkholderia multivorans TaxID=87883 RepID=UPI0004F8B5AD|nr:N-acetyltransferase [Burkholderia multivorans]AIO76535.1 acetyltransferase family protein [Burkholderia multivorans]AOK67766.1 GCN5 family acetyltransferase [Burkholderia multivorans]KVZ80426.1 GCN5 family acetyltransferase [Burkholderia multivorans]PRE60278.1 N-acetyltransferase [Burkholderia multivorans]PRF11259.1 N-acetyltransferase [Burkholderia multivorans]
MSFDPYAPVEVVTLRDERASDVDAIADVIVSAFAGEPEHGQFERRIVDALRADRALAVSLVAERDGRVIGHVACSPVSIGGAAAGDSRWHGLAPLAVRADCRRRSVGAGLVRTALDALRRRGAQGCVVLGDPAYYARFGFAPCADLVFPGAPATHFLALTLDDAAPRPAGIVRYHDAFHPEQAQH